MFGKKRRMEVLCVWLRYDQPQICQRFRCTGKRENHGRKHLKRLWRSGTLCGGGRGMDECCHHPGKLVVGWDKDGDD